MQWKVAGRRRRVMISQFTCRRLPGDWYWTTVMRTWRTLYCLSPIGAKLSGRRRGLPGTDHDDRDSRREPGLGKCSWGWCRSRHMPWRHPWPARTLAYFVRLRILPKVKDDFRPPSWQHLPARLNALAVSYSQFVPGNTGMKILGLAKEVGTLAMPLAV